jgi:hypothetical protein
MCIKSDPAARLSEALTVELENLSRALVKIAERVKENSKRRRMIPALGDPELRVDRRSKESSLGSASRPE